MNPAPVIGRFAPSPTGDLHFGSLVSAVGSYLEAKSAGGKWLIRVEDIDPPREIPGSANRIIADLESMGMFADQPVLYQSTRLHAYQQALNELLDKGLAYHCGCSRKDLPASGIYPGTCRNGLPEGRPPRAVRFKVGDHSYKFFDKLQGQVTDSPANIRGDFVVRRADGLFAYQLAVVIDDSFQGITQVVRGTDLLDSTSGQIALQKALGLTTPEYMHLPLAISVDGKKLSKRFRTDPLKNQDPETALKEALHFLGQNPPPGLSLDVLWDWALTHWNSDLIPRRRAILPGQV